MYENLQNINTMEGVDAILQEYGSLADKTPKSTPIDLIQIYFTPF